MSDINHEFTPEIMCPYCGAEHGDCWEWAEDEGVENCRKCGKEFRYVKFVTIEYSTHPTALEDA